MKSGLSTTTSVGSIDPDSVRPDPNNPNYTIPRTFGVYAIKSPRLGATVRRYRYGNHPVRMLELEREFGRVEQLGLFTDREEAKSITRTLNQ